MDSALRPSSPLVRSVLACRWHFESPVTRTAAVRNLNHSDLDTPIQLFEDVDAPALLAVSWQPKPPVAWPPVLSSAAERVWTADADIVARWFARRDEVPGCLVVVRQPLIHPDRDGQRDWVATVLKALDGDAEAPSGLLTANFFASRDGAFVLNLAEWTSADAHREALRRGSYGRYGSIGSSSLWKAAREHPAITTDHEVHRYLPAATGDDRLNRRI
jgi:hypothetical protein